MNTLHVFAISSRVTAVWRVEFTTRSANSAFTFHIRPTETRVRAHICIARRFRAYSVPWSRLFFRCIFERATASEWGRWSVFITVLILNFVIVLDSILWPCRSDVPGAKCLNPAAVVGRRSTRTRSRVAHFDSCVLFLLKSALGRSVFRRRCVRFFFFLRGFSFCEFSGRVATASRAHGDVLCGLAVKSCSANNTTTQYDIIRSIFRRRNGLVWCLLHTVRT